MNSCTSNKLLRLSKSLISSTSFPTKLNCRLVNRSTVPLNHSPFCFDSQARCFSQSQNVNDAKEDGSLIPSATDRYVFPKPPQLVSDKEHEIVLNKVNECIASDNVGRLFAVVMVGGVQYKITEDDLISVTGATNLKLGEKVRLEKVLLVGGRDFTLVGRPVVRRNVVKIEATVIEKSPAAPEVVQKFRPRKHYDIRFFYTRKLTTLRINSIQAFPQV